MTKEPWPGYDRAVAEDMARAAEETQYVQSALDREQWPPEFAAEATGDGHVSLFYRGEEFASISFVTDWSDERYQLLPPPMRDTAFQMVEQAAIAADRAWAARPPGIADAYDRGEG